jgi:hypothetical protein
MPAMGPLGGEQQIVEGLLEQGLDLIEGPVVAKRGDIGNRVHRVIRRRGRSQRTGRGAL